MVNHGTLVKIMANHDTWKACQDHGMIMARSWQDNCCLKSCFYEMIELNLIMTRQFLFSEKSRTNLTLEIKWESVNKRGRKSTVQTYSYVISCVEF